MDVHSLKPITILGAGSWGTALALHLARRGQAVRIWSIEVAEIAAMLAERKNNRYLPGFDIPDLIEPMENLAEAVNNVDDILVVVPSVGFRSTLTKLKPLIQPHVRIISATKGIDNESGRLLNEISEEILGHERPFAALSGPSFAKEVAAGLPTAVVAASKNDQLVKDIQQRFDCDVFRVHASDDVVGVEAGGIVKNVVAIATGMSDGMAFGADARAAIITHGLAELVRLGTALGGRSETLLGLSGLGDLILTATDNLSRNRRFGLALGQGQDVQAAEREIGQVVEGKKNAELVVKLAAHLRVEMPLCQTIWNILQGTVNAKEVFLKLL